MRRITISLLEGEREALFQLSKREQRNTRSQAAVLVRLGLERLGLLNVVKSEKLQQNEMPIESPH